MAAPSELATPNQPTSPTPVPSVVSTSCRRLEETSHRRPRIDRDKTVPPVRCSTIEDGALSPGAVSVSCKGLSLSPLFVQSGSVTQVWLIPFIVYRLLPAPGVVRFIYGKPGNTPWSQLFFQVPAERIICIWALNGTPATCCAAEVEPFLTGIGFCWLLGF